MAGSGCATIVAREQLRFDNREAEIARVLQYWIEDARFVDCWLYEHDQALIDTA
jgi:hypothetical protein